MYSDGWEEPVGLTSIQEAKGRTPKARVLFHKAVSPEYKALGSPSICWIGKTVVRDLV